MKKSIFYFIFIIFLGNFILIEDTSQNLPEYSNSDHIENYQIIGENMTIYGYKYINNIQKYPANIHLVWEYNNKIYLIDYNHQDIFYRIDPTTGDYTEIYNAGYNFINGYLDLVSNSNEKGRLILFESHMHNVRCFDLEYDDDYEWSLGTAIPYDINDLVIYNSNIYLLSCRQDDIMFRGDTDKGFYAIGSGKAYSTSQTPKGITYRDDIDRILIQKYDPYFGSYIFYKTRAWTSIGNQYNTARLYDALYWDGSNVYGLVTSSAIVYKLDPSDYSELASYDISANVTTPVSFCFDGTYWWVADDNDNKIKKFDTSFNYQTGSDVDVSAQDTTLSGLYFDGTYFYLSGADNLKVYRYDSSWNYQSGDDYTYSTTSGDTLEEFTYRWPYFYCHGIYNGNNYYRIIHGNNWADRGSLSTGDGDANDGDCSFMVLISNYAYFLYKHPDNTNLFLYKKNLDTTDAPVQVADLGTNLELPDINLRGITYNENNNVLSFILKDTADSNKNKYCTYDLSSSTFIKHEEYNVSLMLDRNTNTSNDLPYNLEKGFDINNRYVYQISRDKSSLLKIADLTNLKRYNSTTKTWDNIDGTIVAITDTYLFLKRNSGDIELYKFDDIGDHIQNAIITHPQRDYATAVIDYNSYLYPLEEDMFVQIIGTYKGTANQVKFEGLVHKVEERFRFNPVMSHFKRAYLISPAYFDLEWLTPNISSMSGGLDEFLDSLDDDFTYLTKGAYTDTSDFNSNKEIKTDKNNHRFLDEICAFFQKCWYYTPTGSLYAQSSPSSGVTYDENDCVRIEVSKRTNRINAVVVKGAYVNGTQIESTEQKDDALIQKYSKKKLEITISWINDQTDANTMASSLLALLKTDLTYCKILVRDTTNGMLQVGESITFSHTQKGISSDTYIINQVIHNDKTLLTEYIISNDIRYELEDFQEKLDKDLSEQVYQVSEYAKGLVSDAAYDSSWDGSTDTAPSKNAVYDVINDEIKAPPGMIIKCLETSSLTKSLGRSVQDYNVDACVALMSSDQTIPSAAATKVNIDSYEYNPNSMLDSTNHKIIIKTEGLYLVGGNIYFTDVSGANRVLYVRKNGVSLVDSRNSDTTHAGLSCCTVMYLQVNDEIDYYVYQDYGSDRTLKKEKSRFYVVLLYPIKNYKTI